MPAATRMRLYTLVPPRWNAPQLFSLMMPMLTSVLPGSNSLMASLDVSSSDSVLIAHRIISVAAATVKLK